MRVLIADDSTFMRQALARVIQSDPALELVGRAKDGREAVAMAKELAPDVITLDVEMPEMDGLTALRHILRETKNPPHVLMCSSLTTQGSTASLQALRLGAADVLAKENGAILPGGQSFNDEYLRRVKALAADAADKKKHPTPAPGSIPGSAASPTSGKAKSVEKNPLPVIGRDQFDLVVIGSSTGGPPVLETILAALPAGFPLPVVVAQHMPKLFTESMASRLNELCSLPVIHAQHRDLIEPGKIYICPGHEHSQLISYAGGQLRLRTSIEPKEEVYYPSVNVLFNSAAEATGKRTLAVVLTGIGEDGTRGATQLRKQGATVYAQDRASCVVYGMPRSIAQAGQASAVLTPVQIAATIAKIGPRSAAA